MFTCMTVDNKMDVISMTSDRSTILGTATRRRKFLFTNESDILDSINKLAKHVWRNFLVRQVGVSEADYIKISEERWFLVDLKWQFLNIYRNFQKYFNLEAHKSDFQPNLRKEVDNKNLVVQSFSGPKI